MQPQSEQPLGRSDAAVPSLVARPTVRWDRVTAVASIIIAVCSLSVAWNSFRYNQRATQLAQQHARQSVRPALVVVFPASDERLLGVGIKNVGLGPAHIKSIRFFWDKREVGGWQPALDLLRKECPHDQVSISPFRGAYTYLGVNEKAIVSGVVVPSNKSYGVWEALCVSRLNFRIDYESTYDEHFMLDTRQDTLAAPQERVRLTP